MCKTADVGALALCGCMPMGNHGPGVVRCIPVREFARCYVQVDQHASQICTCLQPGGCSQVCLPPPVPSGLREPLTHMLESPSCRENQESQSLTCVRPLQGVGGCGEAAGRLISQVCEASFCSGSLAVVTPENLESCIRWCPLPGWEAETRALRGHGVENE